MRAEPSLLELCRMTTECAQRICKYIMLELTTMDIKINIRFWILILVSLHIFSFAIAQDEDCNKTKVAVSVEVSDYAENYEWLENDFGLRPKSEWNGFVSEMLVQIISEYEPEITFFPLKGGDEDYHYLLESPMGLTIIGKYEDEGEHTAYQIYGSLIANSTCVPNRRWIVEVQHGEDVKLKQAMKNLAGQLWSLDRKIFLYEKDHPSAPRDPELNIQIEKDYISPLDKESRETLVYAKVFDCRGNWVCDKKGKGHPVYYQDKIDRLDLKKDCYCEGGYNIRNFKVIVTNKHCENDGKYILTKGIDAENKTIIFKTCQLGGPIVEVEKELIIRGLEVKVQPNRKEIEAGQRTDIVLTLNETDPDGTEFPVEGKQLEVKISGLENGTIKAKNGYTTNSEGKVVLDFKAGSNDEKITVTASFQPEDYPDKVTGRNFVKVIPEEFEAKISISKKYNRILQTSQEDSKGEVYKRDINESIEASATIYLALTNTMDMPIFNQTWQYYTPTSVSLLGFHYNSNENQFRSGPKYETNVGIIKDATNYEIEGKEYLTQLPWMLVIDNETKKAVKLIPAGYSIGYEINEVENINSVVYSDNGPERDSKTTTKTGSKSFKLGPVGEEVDDPTIKKSDNWMQDYLKKQGIELPAGVDIPKVSNEETVKKIQPDILVKFGDGETSFGGEATNLVNKELDSGFEKINSSYNWEMTINKKK